VNQNNSGGSFDTTDTLCHRLFIEAENDAAAEAKAESLGCYWDGCENDMDCPCCGDRWSRPWHAITLPTEIGERTITTIEEYAQWMADEYGWTTPDGRIFYADGRVVEIFTQKKERNVR
jgi:hypothetical protein